MTDTILTKEFVRIQAKRKLSKIEFCKRVLIGIFLSPIYWLLAHFFSIPGLRFQFNYFCLGFSLLFKRKSHVPCKELYKIFFYPMDSIRYFEFDFIWNKLVNIRDIEYYLDVSSPRFFPLMLLNKKLNIKAEIINPDQNDLSLTSAVINSYGLNDRCKLNSFLIEDIPFAPASFDLITSISVIEHIPEDNQAVRKLWQLLKPGGKMYLSVMCASKAFEQYYNYNMYGLLKTDENGFNFFQRFYNTVLLQEKIFNVAGKPSSFEIYGEKKAGYLDKIIMSKASDPNYPFWREPYMMARKFGHFKTINELPGLGVIAMEFVKG